MLSVNKMETITVFKEKLVAEGGGGGGGGVMVLFLQLFYSEGWIPPAQLKNCPQSKTCVELASTFIKAFWATRYEKSTPLLLR